MTKQNKQEHHHRNMIKEMGRKAKKIAESFSKLSEKTQDRVAHSVTDTLVRKSGITSEPTQANLKRYCIFTSSLVGAAKHDPTGTSINKIRTNILENLPKDIADFAKLGKSKDEIMEFYWGVAEFQGLFEKLGWDRGMLESMVDGEIK